MACDAEGNLAPKEQKTPTTRKDSDNNPERSMTMKESKYVTKDPICGMTVDETTTLHAERCRD